MSSDSFKNVTYKLFTYKSYIMFKQYLALNNSQKLIFHKTQPTIYIYIYIYIYAGRISNQGLK